MNPIPSEHLTDARFEQLQSQGYTLVPQAIPPKLLVAARRRFDELIADYKNLPTAVHTPETGAIDINRVIEVEPIFAELIDLEGVFAYVERLQEGDVRLLGAAMLNYMPPHSPARCGWHQGGGPYTRLTYLLSDLAEDGGPTAVVPGTHRDGQNPPGWCNDEGGQPRVLPGMTRLAGRAGDCMINNTSIWHTSTPNVSDQPRRIMWVVFKREGQAPPPPSQHHLMHTAEFFARQTDPRRRKLIEAAVVSGI